MTKLLPPPPTPAASMNVKELHVIAVIKATVALRDKSSAAPATIRFHPNEYVMKRFTPKLQKDSTYDNPQLYFDATSFWSASLTPSRNITILPIWQP